jgi:hypothetical protein
LGAILNGTVLVGQYNFSSYQWIQIANSDPTPVTKSGVKLKNSIVDGDLDKNGRNKNYPFYYSKEKSMLLKNTFADRPGVTGISNYKFSATATLYGVDGSILTPIMSYTWGYKVTNGITSLLPLGITGYKVNLYYLKKF